MATRPAEPGGEGIGGFRVALDRRLGYAGRAEQMLGKGRAMTFQMTQMLDVTDLAAEKAKSLLVEKGFADGALRVFVVGGGCSGYQYGMALATEAEDGDMVIEKAGVRFLVDDESAPLLTGSRVDYIDDVMKQGFSITNPNASHSCACGSSFDTADKGGSAQARSCV